MSNEMVFRSREGLKTVYPSDIANSESRYVVKSLRTIRVQVSSDVVTLIFPLAQLRVSC
jgi:hypothetical protein